MKTDMEIEIKLKNRLFNLHIFENYSILEIKEMLRRDPLVLLEEIERLEKMISPKGPPPKIGDIWS